MDKKESDEIDRRMRILETYYRDFFTAHCKEIFLCTSKVIRRIMHNHTGVIHLSGFVKQHKLCLSNPLYHDFYMKGIYLIEDGATPALFQVVMEYEYDKLVHLQPQIQKQVLAELYILKTCMMYIRTLNIIEFQTLARKTFNKYDNDLLMAIDTELRDL